MEVHLGIDIGGTFTDVLAEENGTVVYHGKIPSCSDPASSLRNALARAFAAISRPCKIRFSTTVATNALLRNRLPKTGLIITDGFRHILELARNEKAGPDVSSPSLITRALVPLEYIYEIDERTNAHGAVIVPVNKRDAATIAAWCKNNQLESVAISLLHSYRNPDSERNLKTLLLGEDSSLKITLSSEVLSEAREQERTIQTCLTAALQTLFAAHLKDVTYFMRGQNVCDSPLIMQSSGGLQNLSSVRARPLTTVLSGASATVVGMSLSALCKEFSDVLMFDMGGTSTDVSLIQDGQPFMTTRGHVGHYPIKTPMIDIISIGAGGGSIAQAGPGNRWHVGPLSAGSEPGPACYNKGGTKATVTDANLILNRLPDTLLAGEIELSRDAVCAALSRFGQARRRDVQQTAQGIIQLVNHTMCGAIRQAGTKRGIQPQDSVFTAVGGAGPLHAADIATLLGIKTICIPVSPGLAAASGLLAAPISTDLASAYPNSSAPPEIMQIISLFDKLEREGRKHMIHADPTANFKYLRSLEFGYRDMSTNLLVALPSRLLTPKVLGHAIVDFHKKHEDLCGFSCEGRRKVVLSTVRLKITTASRRPYSPKVSAKSGLRQIKNNRSVFFFKSDGFIDCPVYDRTGLGFGTSFSGPAIVQQYDSTVTVPPGFTVNVDTTGNLIMTRT